MRRCPKCNSYWVSGPHFVQGYERLRYSCIACGYSTTTPCRDASQPASGYQKNVTPAAGDQRAEAPFPESCCEGAPDE